MKIELNKSAWKLIMLVAWLLAAIFALSSCTCGDKGDEDTNDDIDDDDTDDDTDDDIAEGWYFYTIDEGGGFLDIAIDSNNKIHISYYGGVHRDLMYATNKSGAWQLFNVETINPGATYYISAALDSKGKVHISYYEPYTKLKYATNKSGSWQIFVVKDSLTSGEDGHNDIGVDSNDKAHIVFFHCGGLNEDDKCRVGDLKYATNKSGSWQISTIDGGGSFEAGRWHLSMAMDSSDKIHASYYRCSDCGTTVGALWYATNVSGSWQKEKIADGLLFTHSIAVDSNGKVHISAYDKNENLSYATNTSGAWEIVVVDSNKRAGPYNSIAVDSSGYIHIGYYDYANDDIKYATNKSGTWQTLVIDPALTGDISGGGGVSIAVDSIGYVHIAYGTGGLDSILKYATNRPPEE